MILAIARTSIVLSAPAKIKKRRYKSVQFIRTFVKAIPIKRPKLDKFS